MKVSTINDIPTSSATLSVVSCERCRTEITVYDNPAKEIKEVRIPTSMGYLTVRRYADLTPAYCEHCKKILGRV